MYLSFAGPSKKLTIVVSDNSRSCNVGGHEYQLGSPFSFMVSCTKYICDCHSDGSWECSGEEIDEGTCEPDGEREPAIDENRTVHQSVAERSELIEINQENTYSR